MATVLERTVLVEDISYETDDIEELENKLTIHFSKRQNGGGDVEKVMCPFGGSMSRALVVFESDDVLKTILDKRHTLGDTLLKVYQLPPVFDVIRAKIDEFYWETLPRDKAKKLVSQVETLIGHSNATGTQFKIETVTATVDQLKEIKSYILSSVGVLSEITNTKVDTLVERCVHIHDIPFVTNEATQLQKDIKELVRKETGAEVENVLCRIKGDASRVIVVFKSVKDRDHFRVRKEYLFYEESIQVTGLPEVFKPVVVRVQDFYLQMIPRVKQKKLRDAMQVDFGASFTTDCKTLQGSVNQIHEAHVRILASLGIHSDTDGADCEREELTSSRISKGASNEPPALHLTESYIRQETNDHSTMPRSQHSEVVDSTSGTYEDKPSRKKSYPHDFTSTKIKNVISKANIMYPPTEEQPLEVVEGYYSTETEKRRQTSGKTDIFHRHRPQDVADSMSKPQPTHSSSSICVPIEKIVFQYMKKTLRSEISNIETQHDIKIKIGSNTSEEHEEQHKVLVELKATKSKKGTDISKALTEFNALHSEVIKTTKTVVVSFKGIAKSKHGKVQEKLQKKFHDIVVSWDDVNDNCIVLGDVSVVETAADELNESVSCYESMAVDDMAYAYLLIVKDDKLEEIKKKYSVMFELQSAASANASQKLVHIKPNKSWKKKCKLEELKKAKDDFIDLYQGTFFTLKRTAVKCPDVAEDVLSRAVEDLKKQYPNQVIVNRLTSKEIIIGTDEGIVEEVVKEFRNLAGLLSTRRLKRKISNKMEENANQQLPSSAASDQITDTAFVTPEGLEIRIITGDITKQRVDAVVNSSTANMKHSSGLSNAIAMAAGPGLQKECEDILRGSSIPVGECRESKSFKLSCKRLVHAVGPRHDGDGIRFSRLLKKTFKSALTMTDTQLCFQSVAIPLISSGRQGGSIPDCSEALVAALEDFSRRQKIYLRQVVLVNKDEEATRILTQACSQKFKAQSQIQGSSNLILSTTNTQTIAKYNTRKGLEVTIETGDITKASVDLIVNAANKHLRHGGGVAGAISKAAGREMQDECSLLMRSRSPLKVGECVVTDGYKLLCNKILHTAGPVYGERTSDTQFYNELKNTFLSALRYANIPVEMKTIAVPLISSGIYGGPKLVCAEALLDAIDEFNGEPYHIIQTIHLINLDDPSSQALLQVYSRKYTDPRVGRSIHPVVVSSVDMKTKTSRRIKLDIKEDDITKQDVDIIVNPTDSTLWNTLGVAKAISRAAGNQLQEQCNSIMKSRKNVALTTGEVIETRGFKLKSKYILHTRSPYYEGENYKQRYQETLSQVYQQCLSDANGKAGVRSIAIPIIGAGVGGCPKDVCAEALVTAVKEFDEREENLRLERIVIVSFDRDAVFIAKKLVENKDSNGSGENLPSSLKPKYNTAMSHQNDFPHRHNSYKLTTTTQGSSNVQGTDDYKVSQWSNSSGAVPKRDTGIVRAEHVTRDREHIGKVSSHQGTGLLSYVAPAKVWLTNKVSSALQISQGDPSYASVAAGNATPRNVVGSVSDQNKTESLICAKCYTDIQLKHLEGCNHTFCTKCITQYISPKSKCLKRDCGSLYCVVEGKMIPTPSTMTYYIETHLALPGETGNGAVVIKYNFPDGNLSAYTHKHHGKRYKGNTFTAYLPNSESGIAMVWLLRTAFITGLIFDVGLDKSSQPEVKWSGRIVHKRNVKGGFGKNGYPDADYLKRVTEQLEKCNIRSSLSSIV